MWDRFKISFDWDDTASLKQIKRFMGLFDGNLAVVFIITARSEKDDNKDIKMAKAFMEIDYDVQIIYLDGGNKWPTLEKMGIDYHFDDMVEEIQLIQQNCSKTMGFLVSTNIGEAMWEASNLTIKNT